MKVFASPLVPNSPLTPKSQRRTWPDRVIRIFEGLMSGCGVSHLSGGCNGSHASVYNLAAMEIGQAIQDALCYFAQDLFARPATELLDLSVNAIQAAAFAVFHSDGDCTTGIIHERPVVLTNMLRRAIFVEGQFSDYLFLDIWVGVGRNYLYRSVTAL